MKLDALKSADIELTDAIRSAVDHLLERLDPLCGRFGGAAAAHVEIGKTTRHHAKGPFYRAEINLRIPNKLLRAESEMEDLYAALEEVEKELKRQLSEEKDRFLEDRRGGPESE
jgi:ribosomal subunit interface protein